MNDFLGDIGSPCVLNACNKKISQNLTLIVKNKNIEYNL